MREKAEVKRLGGKGFFFLGVLAFFFAFSPAFVWADDAPEGFETEDATEKAGEAVPGSELDHLKAEWEAVREQQVQMIREKEEQLEKLKEEIFAKMKTLNASEGGLGVSSLETSQAAEAISPEENEASIITNTSQLETAKAAFQAERKKFFKEMNRQKETLRQLQSALDEKAKQLEAERDRFEQEKKTADF